MKKKSLMLIGFLLLFTVCLSIPAVRSFGYSALSVFRVNDTKTIKITLADIEEFMAHPLLQKESVINWKKHHAKVNQIDHAAKPAKPEIKTLADISEFDGFSVKLPKELKNEQPKLSAVDAKEVNVVLNTDKINEFLTKMGISTLLDQSYNGKEINIQTPPAVMAQYKEVMLLATQGIYVEDADEILDGLWTEFLKMPFLTENIRSQLAKIDLHKRDVYLPVIMGIGREVSIGNLTGYVYSTKDLEQVYPLLSDNQEGKAAPAVSKEASVLIWTKGGVLYCLAGEKSDNDLAKIARSIR